MPIAAHCKTTEGHVGFDGAISGDTQKAKRQC